jgi:drug/metabolite transporter (DMT)-like permease
MENISAKGYLCVVVAAVLWASSGTAGKALFGRGITPFDVVQVRLTVSALLLAFIFSVRFRNLFRIRKIDIGYFFLLGGLAMCLVQITYFYAISKIQVAAAIFLQYLSPVMVAFFSICFWRERLTVAKVLSLVLCNIYPVSRARNAPVPTLDRSLLFFIVCGPLHEHLLPAIQISVGRVYLY